jgi:hypothetical protein
MDVVAMGSANLATARMDISSRNNKRGENIGNVITFAASSLAQAQEGTDRAFLPTW